MPKQDWTKELSLNGRFLILAFRLVTPKVKHSFTEGSQSKRYYAIVSTDVRDDSLD